MKNKNEFFENIKTYKLVANKSLGQNFLINPQISESIVQKLYIQDDDYILEIGAGLGSLSYFLVGKSKVDLIDIDERMLSYLNNEFGNIKNATIYRQNILKADLSKYTKIIGNLPYYITSSIIKKILIDAKNATKIVLMTQKEVYLKIAGGEISPLSLLLNYVAEISDVMNVNRNNFTPVPHVDSVVFTLTPNKNIKNDDNEYLLSVMTKLFIYRRKNILNCLTSFVKDKDLANQILNELSVDINKRPEQLDINFYKNLINKLQSLNVKDKIK